MSAENKKGEWEPVAHLTDQLDHYTRQADAFDDDHKLYEAKRDHDIANAARVREAIKKFDKVVDKGDKKC